MTVTTSQPSGSGVAQTSIICPWPGRGGLATCFWMKTITLSDEAYARIEAARCVPGESESDVVLRALPSKAAEAVMTSGWRRFACANPAEREELRRSAGVIEEEFERVEPEDGE